MVDVNLVMASARALVKASDFAGACTVLEQAYAQAPDHPGLADALAGAYRRDARYADSVRVAEAAAASVQLRYEQGMSLAHLGHGAAALAAFDAALALDPHRAAAWMASAGPALEVVGPEDALRRLAQACGCAGANSKYWGMLAAATRLLGDEGGAQALHAEHLARHPRRRALWDGIEAIRPLLAPGFRVFGLSASLLRAAMAEARQPGMVLEFGVRRGTSIAVLAEDGQPVHGFDSFEGLPDDWGGEGRGVLTTGAQLPAVPANVTLHAGWFDDTLAPFLDDHRGLLRLVNIDSDIYRSARLVLFALVPRMRPGTIVVFDEMIGNRTWAEDEFKAWEEFVAEFGVAAEIFALSPFTKQVALRVTGVA
jgi:hypothetical protein